MSYVGSEAYSLDAERGRSEYEARRASFGVVDGGGLDARARRAVSSQFLSVVARVMAVAFVVMALGICRIALSTMTVSNLRANESLRTQISEARQTGDTLRAERAVVSSTSRVTRIATQNMGMVKASSLVAATPAPSSEDPQASASMSADGAYTANEGTSASTNS